MGTADRLEREQSDDDAEPKAPDFVGITVSAVDGPDGWQLTGPLAWALRGLRALFGGKPNGR